MSTESVSSSEDKRTTELPMKGSIFFDLDGTLTDPKLGIVRSIRYAMERLQIECPDDNDLTGRIGPPLLGSFSELVGDSLATKALEYYRERFSDCGWQENTPYAGIFDALDELAASGYSLYVATSKPSVFADRIISHFEFDSYFSAVFGSELDGTRSNKGDLLRFALSEVGAARTAIMVGDRKHDVLGAKQNGMCTVGVTYGYGSRQELEEAGADVIVAKPAQIARQFA